MVASLPSPSAVADAQSGLGAPARPPTVSPSLGIFMVWNGLAVNLCVFLGAAALGLSPFLVWVKATVGTYAVSGDGIDQNPGKLVLALAILLVIVALCVRERRATAIVAVVVGGIAGAIAIFNLADISNQARILTTNTNGFITGTVGGGLIIALLAAASIVTGGILGILETHDT